MLNACWPTKSDTNGILDTAVAVRFFLGLFLKSDAVRTSDTAVKLPLSLSLSSCVLLFRYFHFSSAASPERDKIGSLFIQVKL